MRRIIAFTVVSALVFMLSMGVFGADILYRMLNADEVESFKADQTAFVVAQIIDIKDEKITAKVMKVISGTVKSQNVITIDKFNYSWTDPEVTPAVNDYCVLSLKKTGSGYKIAWGAYQADSGDYKALKLYNENIMSQGLRIDLGCIEWYVNSGGKEKDFFFQGTSAYVKRPDGETVQIYAGERLRSTPKASIAATLKQFETPTPVIGLEAEKTQAVSSKGSIPGSNKTVIGFAVIIVIAVTGGIMVHIYKRNEK